MQIILVGYMGSGKSTIGRKLAKKLDLHFIDLDDYIADREQCSINSIFKNKGEIYFRKLENKALEEITNSGKGFVLAVGGGTPCYANNIELINKSEISIYLKASIQELYDRLVTQKSERPLIKNIGNDNLKEFIAKHLFERLPYYEKARLIITTDEKSTADVVDEIMLNMR